MPVTLTRWVIPALFAIAMVFPGEFQLCHAAAVLPVVSSANATAANNGSVQINIGGSGFFAGSAIRVNGTNLPTTYVSYRILQATFASPPTQGTVVSLLVMNPAPNAGQSNSYTVWIPASVQAATRLLDQTTFGATDSLIAHVQSVGLNGFLNEQLVAHASQMPNLPSTLPASCSNSPGTCNKQNWWNNVMTGDDQLRQRVSFALGQIFVISYNQVNGYAFPQFENVLANDAFNNWLRIMKDVALSPAMGGYLNMLNSGKAVAGTIANENFARENMQLFNIGLNMLNSDGTLQLDTKGSPIPAYTELQVEAFARAFTGWTYATPTGGIPASFIYWTPNYTVPLVPLDAQHDTSAKALLNTTLPAGQTTVQDFNGAMVDVFNHPNVGPFVCKQLIQHLVKSNPSPEYVARVAAVFANNGSGVRGDMRSILKAIFLDQEARAGDTGSVQTDGHLREPILWAANVVRALGVVPLTGVGAYNALNFTTGLGEEVFRPPSVFNFFTPDYGVPDTTLLGPEFGLETTASSIARLNAANATVYDELPYLNVDLTATSPLGKLAVTSNNALLDELSKLFLHGQMSTQMRTAILNVITPSPYPQQRVRIAVYLVITSSQFKVAY